MDEALLWKVLGGGAGSGVLVWVLRLIYVQWSKQNPGIEQAHASTELYGMLREQVKEQAVEIRLLKKQIALLERLCMANGINVHELYEQQEAKEASAKLGESHGAK